MKRAHRRDKTNPLTRRPTFSQQLLYFINRTYDLHLTELDGNAVKADGVLPRTAASLAAQQPAPEEPEQRRAVSCRGAAPGAKPLE